MQTHINATQATNVATFVCFLFIKVLKSFNI